MLFQKSLQERAAPSDWLESWITAIHKKGAKDVLSNYRPVSLTSVICKLFESFIKESIIEHMTENRRTTWICSIQELHDKSIDVN